MDNTFSRKPNDYRPSTHAIQRAKERDIDGDAIETAIVNGRVVDKTTDEKCEDYGIVLRNQWLQTEYEIAIVPPSWTDDDDSTGVVKSCWLPNE